MKIVPFLSLAAGVAGVFQRSATGPSNTSVPALPPAATPKAAADGCGPPITHDDDFVPDYVLNVTYQDVLVACQSRASVVVNGSSPGPALRIPAGKTTWIRVYNSMSDYNLTMHWHGLSQRTADFSDGTPSASQWPIAPSYFFDYAVHPELDDAGTYFYHSHVGFQAVSAAGALIVEDPGPPPYTYDEERLIFLSDFFNKTDDDIQYGLTANPFVWSGETDAVLINGAGVAKGEVADSTASCSLPIIHVEPGKTYRWRFIGGVALSMVQFGVVGHDNLTIVAADGQYTLPHTESYIQITSGQRYDVIFRAKTEKELANGPTDFTIQFETKQRPEVYYGYGVLRYSSMTGTNTIGTNTTESISTAPAKPPLTLSNVTYNWLEYALEPLKPNGFPTADEVTRRVYIYDRQVLTTQSIVWQLNGLRWNETADPLPNEIPYLVNIYENGQAAIPDYEAALKNGGWDNVTSTWPAKIGEVLEIIWINTGSLVNSNGGVDYHPFHAHGNHYYDIGSGNGTYDPAANELKLRNYNPVLRDTTNLYRYETTTTAGVNAGWRGWRLRITDPGVWMIHCHILQHMVMGMQSVWVFGDADEIQRIPHYDAAGYLEFKGSAYGNETFAPSYVHRFDD